MVFENAAGTDPDEICSLFALKFSRMFTEENLSSQEISAAAENVPLHEHNLDRLVLDESKIVAAAVKLKSSTSVGPDGIPSLLLKKCIAELIIPLRHLFNLSLAKGVFPDLWKTAFMFPVYKKGDKRNIDNYRGISALCAVSKLFELAVLDPVFFHCKRLICVEQHGFMPGRSTATNLLTFTTYLTDGLSRRSQTDAIYTDLSAAFDKLNHSIAVAKLNRLGFGGNLLGWFQSYLSGRTIRVKIGESISSLFPAHSGVAQGSHLGPLIFLLNFNDSNFVLDGPRLAYADDLKIFRYVNSIEDAESLQHQLNKFAQWCEANRMTLNPVKCSVITFTRKYKPIKFNYAINGVIIPRADCVKDLGVLLDAKLSYKEHASYIVAKASRQLGFIFRAGKTFTDIYCLKTLYCALVRSTLEYCSVVWNPLYQNSSDRIEGVQRRFIRFALRSLPWRDPFRLPSYESRCQLISLDTLAARRNTARALIISDLLTSRVDCPDLLQQLNLQARSRALRDGSFFRIPLRTANYSAHSSITGLQRVFNRIASLQSVP